MSTSQYISWEPLSMSWVPVYTSWVPLSMSWVPVYTSWVPLSICHEYLSIRHEYLSVYVMSTYQYMSWVPVYTSWVRLSICHEYLSIYVMSTCLYVMSTSQYIPWVDLHVKVCHEYLSVYIFSYPLPRYVSSKAPPEPTFRPFGLQRHWRLLFKGSVCDWDPGRCKRHDMNHKKSHYRRRNPSSALTGQQLASQRLTLNLLAPATVCARINP